MPFARLALNVKYRTTREVLTETEAIIDAKGIGTPPSPTISRATHTVSGPAAAGGGRLVQSMAALVARLDTFVRVVDDVARVRGILISMQLCGTKSVNGRL